MADSEAKKTILLEGTEIVGSIKCSTDIEINGKLNGDLTCAGNVTIGKKANVKGNLSVNAATILGQVNGNTTAKDRIDLKSSAKITGDIRASRLTVEDGVVLVGKSEVSTSMISARTTKNDVQETSPADAESGDKNSRKDEIRKNIKEELKEKTGSIFGRK